MIDLPDEKRTPHVTVIVIEELGVCVLLKLGKKQRKELNLCAIVSEKTQLEGRMCMITV